MGDYAAPRFFAALAALCALLAVTVWPLIGYSWRESAGLLSVGVVFAGLARVFTVEIRARRRAHLDYQIRAVHSWSRPDANTIRVRRTA